ncbi:MAG: site-specific recombinase XerD [Verrucomicrobiales bacterium]|nr:site-specific recombinase XerD [Verrucomicrobiales bacterium]
MTSRVQSYLRQRRALGYKLFREGRQLLNFARCADRARHRRPLNTALALRWATLPRAADPAYHARRLDIVRVFARHQAVREPATQVPPRHILGPAFRRKSPHLFTPGQLRQLLRRCGTLSGQFRGLTYRTLLGLLAASGLRISEALALMVQDVDLDQGVLTIRFSKFEHTRLVPLHPSALSALRRYARKRASLFPRSQTFFVSDRGQRLQYGAVNRVFIGLSGDMIPANGRRRVRLHDLRHTFACRVLLRWQHSRRGAAGRVVILSRYLGHVHIRDTYWYLTAVPELLKQSIGQFGPPLP